MSTPHPFRATIPPVPEGTPRPRWSVMIPTYHCASFLRETLASVLAQAPGPEQMQIEVVDDCSTQDDPAAVVAEVGQGRVAFFQQPRNVGHTRNFDTCLQRARGHLVHLLHGDDVVRPGFYEAMQRAFEARPDIGAAFCRYLSMDEAGHWLSISHLEQPEGGVLEGWLEYIGAGQRLQVVCMVVRRAAYEQLGGWDRRILRYGEDWEMWTRIGAHYPVWYEPEPLALYRIHRDSLSGEAVRTGQNMRDMRSVIEINRALLPPHRADAISREAAKACALGALRRARRIMERGDLETPLAQMRATLHCSQAPEVVARTLSLFAAWLYHAMWVRRGQR